MNCTQGTGANNFAGLCEFTCQVCNLQMLGNLTQANLHLFSSMAIAQKPLVCAPTSVLWRKRQRKQGSKAILSLAQAPRILVSAAGLATMDTVLPLHAAQSMAVP